MTRIPGTYRNTQTPEGTIGVVTSDLSRYTDFQNSMFMLAKPQNTRFVAAKNAVDVAGNCNTVLRNMEGEWVLIMGDDHVFEQDFLFRLLAHDVDVVVPLCFTRRPPYVPVVYSGQNEDGDYIINHDLPEHGLVEIHAAGSAGMLIRRHVVEALEDPWFRPTPDAIGMNEDLYFCQQVREAGFSIWCDVDTPLGHIASPITVWPGYREGWAPNLVLGQGSVLPLNQFRPKVPA